MDEKGNKAVIYEKNDNPSQWSCEQCTFENFKDLNYCEICYQPRPKQVYYTTKHFIQPAQHIANNTNSSFPIPNKNYTVNLDDVKENKSDIDEKYFNSDSDDNHEVLVHDHDLRRPIHELSNTKFQNSSFVKCIGQLYIEYNYPQNNYKLSMAGTGTVIKTKVKNGLFSAATAFVLSAAHNARRNVWQCCDQYFEKVKDAIRINNCPKCKKQFNKKKDMIMIKATLIQFQRRVTNSLGFGIFEEGYECKIEYLDEYNYKAFPYPKSGFDWVLLSFIDEGGYYWKHCKKIELEAIDTTKISKYNQFMIIGYPGEKSKEMWGYKMNQNGLTMKYETNKKTNNIYLKHKEIDASPGQSGAAMATELNNKIVIWGVHVGGNDKDQYNKYNVATLLNKYIVEIVNCIVNGKLKWVNKEKWTGNANYYGFVKNKNMMHGYGKCVWNDGKCYEGSFINEKYYGYGKYAAKNGDVYEGLWQNGQEYGYGKYVWYNGAYYEGLYKNGKKNGYGKYGYENGNVYEGNYVNDKKSGKGKYIWANGKVYEGSYANNKKNGYGKITYIDGMTYEGEWNDEKRHGKGKEMDKNGNIIWEGQYAYGNRCT